MLEHEVPANVAEVLDSCDEAGEQLVGERPGLEPRIGGTYLVRTQPVGELPADVRQAEVRSVELGGILGSQEYT